MTATASPVISIPRRWWRQLQAKARGGDHSNDTHTKQREFIVDARKRIAVCGGRRGGKSHALARRLLRAGELHPGETSVYVTLTRGKAQQILWDDCLARLTIKQQLGLRLVEKAGLLYIYQPNGSRIWLVGVDDKAQIQKIRGGKYSAVVIDEAMAMPEYLRELVLDSAEPALMDLDGACVLAGTPCAIMAGYFFEVTTGANPEVEQWPTHHFSLLDNPFLPHGKEWLEQKLQKDYGGDASHPTYRREFLGEWVEDIGALVYPFTWDNSWTPNTGGPFGLPDGEYVYGLGVDLGYGENTTAFVLAAKRKDAGEVYILEATTQSRWNALEVATHVAQIRERVKHMTGQPMRVVVDEGGLGKGYTDQMQQLGVGCEAAEKSEKRVYQDYVQGLIQSCSAKVHFAKCRPLIDEARKLQFDHETGKEDERYLNHACDAFLYITRAFFPMYKPQELQPEPGSPEYIKREMDKHKEALIKKRQQGKEKRYA